MGLIIIWKLMNRNLWALGPNHLNIFPIHENTTCEIVVSYINTNIISCEINVGLKFISYICICPFCCLSVANSQILNLAQILKFTHLTNSRTNVELEVLGVCLSCPFWNMLVIREKSDREKGEAENSSMHDFGG